MDIPGDSSTLLDDSPRTKVYLIDFGKAVFTKPKDTQYWWLQQESAYNRGFEMYKNEVQPRNKDELAVWCKNLPLTMARPDHGYRLYRSIQTLPKTQRDRKLLPYLIDPIAEDVYSMGALIWKIISGMEPWPGVFDIDLKALRENVSNDESIDRIIHRETPGPTSAQLLKMFLRVNPEDRCSITEILGWLERPAIRKALLCEWNIQANAGSRTRPRALPWTYVRSDKVEKTKRKEREYVVINSDDSYAELESSKRQNRRHRLLQKQPNFYNNNND